MMLGRTKLSSINRFSPLRIFKTVYASHQPDCPVVKSNSSKPVCPPCGSGVKDGGGGGKFPQRQDPGRVRLGFIPDHFFLFFHSKTGVSGPYLFLFNVTIYLFSKEIYVMEHEYFSGLSILLMITLAHRNSGGVCAYLDKEVDDTVEAINKSRRDTIELYETTIKNEKEAQFRTEGQKLVIDAKKENVVMQLEAIYRERCVHVHKTVRGRLDYHSKKYYAEARIHQKWMIDWILKNVRSSITPEFEKATFDKCIQDLVSLAGRA